MKKFLYVAVMAVVTLAFTACKSNLGTSADYAEGKTVVINEEKGTVNGVKYDNTKEMCWAWTINEKTNGAEVKLTYYVWATEFHLVATCEMEMYECSRSGRIASYAYIQAPKSLQSESACENANNQ